VGQHWERGPLHVPAAAAGQGGAALLASLLQLTPEHVVDQLLPSCLHMPLMAAGAVDAVQHVWSARFQAALLQPLADGNDFRCIRAAPGQHSGAGGTSTSSASPPGLAWPGSQPPAADSTAEEAHAGAPPLTAAAGGGCCCFTPSAACAAGADWLQGLTGEVVSARLLQHAVPGPQDALQGMQHDAPPEAPPLEEAALPRPAAPAGPAQPPPLPREQLCAVERLTPAATRGALSAGYTLVLRGCDARWPAVAAAAGQLEAQLGLSVGANLYLTPPGCTGLAAHYDDHDVLVVQLAGSKGWLVQAPPGGAQQLPLTYEPRAPVAPLAAAAGGVRVVHMRRGDVLYLPRGWAHQAAAGGEAVAGGGGGGGGGVQTDPGLPCASMHMTFGVNVDLVSSWLGLAHLAVHLLPQTTPPGAVGAAQGPPGQQHPDSGGSPLPADHASLLLSAAQLCLHLWLSGQAEHVPLLRAAAAPALVGAARVAAAALASSAQRMQGQGLLLLPPGAALEGGPASLLQSLLAGVFWRGVPQAGGPGACECPGAPALALQGGSPCTSQPPQSQQPPPAQPVACGCIQQAAHAVLACGVAQALAPEAVGAVARTCEQLWEAAGPPAGCLGAGSAEGGGAFDAWFGGACCVLQACDAGGRAGHPGRGGGGEAGMLGEARGELAAAVHAAICASLRGVLQRESASALAVAAAGRCLRARLAAAGAGRRAHLAVHAAACCGAPGA
jgi:hypothetical protein